MKVMIILKHNTLNPNDLFVIERLILKLSSEPYKESLDYSLLNKPRGEIYGHVCGIFKRLGICQLLGISTSEFLDLLIDIEKSYLDNPFHSFYHGVDTAMFLYHMIEVYHMAIYLTNLDVIILMLAALCHDAGHPGNNNQFEVNCKTERALKFSNLSVLESHSATIALELLDKHQVFRHLESKHRVDECKAAMVQMILSTDMICHFALKENIDQLYHVILQQGVTLKPLFQSAHNPYRYFEPLLGLPKRHATTGMLDAEQRQMMCNILLHAADISNPCRPWPVFHQLSRRVCEEFFRQGKREKERGLDVMDQAKSHPSKVNVDFIDCFVRPYFESLARLFPEARVLVKNCRQNREEWLKLETVEMEEGSVQTTAAERLQLPIKETMRKQLILHSTKRQRKSEDIPIFRKETIAMSL